MAFYNDLADHYHLLFQDWDRSITWQAGVLGPLLEKELAGTPSLRILDCACGIGTQALGLVARGHVVTGTDISGTAIDRARREAEQRGLAIRFATADMRDLSAIGDSPFDVVLAADNALPHLQTEVDLTRAVREICGKLREGGMFLATIRDYDDLIATRPTITPPAFFQDGEHRRLYHQVWDWSGDRQYTLHLYLTRETPQGWDCRHFVSNYRALLREELDATLHKAGFAGIRWLMPVDSGFYQPLVLARRQSD